MDMGQIQKVIIQQSNDKNDKIENYNKMKKDYIDHSKIEKNTKISQKSKLTLGILLLIILLYVYIIHDH